MPPRAKFTRDEIVDMALSITKEEGIDAVTARELGRRLGSSARPIFTVFESMDEVRECVIARAKELYKQYVDGGLQSQIPFKGVGTAYIRFAIEQPKLFQMLFMRVVGETKDVSVILPVIDDNYGRILESVQGFYNLDRETSERLYQHLWTYTHGIAAMFATGLCSYTAEEIEERMTEVFKGLLFVMKGGNSHDKN